VPQMLWVHETQITILDGGSGTDFFQMQPLRVWAHQVRSDLNNTGMGIPNADTKCLGKPDATGL